MLSTGITPDQLPNLYAWLDGADANAVVLDGNVVTSWLDKSGKDHHATGTVSIGPQLENDGLLFSNKYLHWHSIAAFPEECTVFLALYFDPTHAFHHYPICDIDTTGNLTRFTFRRLSNGQYNFFANSGQSVLAEETTGSHIVTLRRDAATKTAEMHIDGVLRGSDTYNAITSSQGELDIGRSGSFVSPQYFKGKIHEIIACDSLLNASHIQLTEHYLSTKWAIPLQS